MAQAAPVAPNLTVKNFQLEVVHHFTYSGSAAADNLSLDVELDKRIGKAATNLFRLTERVWENKKLTVNTKIAEYRLYIEHALSARHSMAVRPELPIQVRNANSTPFT